MENIDKQAFTKLEQLLQNKDYEALSAQQQTWVDKYLTVEQYNYSRRILLWSKDQQKVQMSSNTLRGIKSRLDTAFDNKHKSGWWLKSVPLYLNLLMMLLVGIIIWWLFSTQSIEMESKEVVVYQVDTVVQTKIIYIDSIVEKPVIIEKTKVVKQPVYIRDTVYTMPMAIQLDAEKNREEPIQRYSLKESKKLLEWMVKVD